MKSKLFRYLNKTNSLVNLLWFSMGFLSGVIVSIVALWEFL